MTFLQAFWMSLIQGVTEFLPVSSDGHLLLAQNLFHLKESELAFRVLVHGGTLLATLVVLRGRITPLLRYALGEGWRTTAREGVDKAWLGDPRGHMIVAVIVASIPTALIGVVAKDYFENNLSSPTQVGWQLCVTGALLASVFLRRSDPAPGHLFPLWAALAIGVMQGIAIIPAISRSGSTIALALLLGLSRDKAWEFSFLISIPAILGALALEAKDIAMTSSFSTGAGAMGFVVAAFAGWVSLKLLRRFVRGGQFPWFSLYCFAVGIWAILWFRG